VAMSTFPRDGSRVCRCHRYSTTPFVIGGGGLSAGTSTPSGVGVCPFGGVPGICCADHMDVTRGFFDMGKSASKQLSHSLSQASERAAGAHLTRESRDRTLDRFQEAMTEAGYNQLRSTDDIAGRHLSTYVESRIEDGISPRTLANEMSHLRAVVRDVIANNPDLSNKALGIDGGSRIGSKTAVSDQEMRTWTDQARDLGRDGIAAALEVSRELGLRSQEVIRADAEQLRTWSREATVAGRVTVIHGTKGGRVRDTTVPDPGRTVAVLERAAAVAEAQGGYLVARADGSPAESLKSATTIYRSYNDRHDVDAHRCRYAYAQEVYQHHRDQGHSHREACSRTSVDLGHGDGRGRYVASVYLR
jgi:integrase